MRKIRIGCGAGYAGDRIEPAVELMENGNLDYIIFECLAERTIALGQQEKLKDPSKGYNPLLELRMRSILKIAKAKQIKIISNMGVANPIAAIQKTKEIAVELGITGLKIAAVTGDDIGDSIKDYYQNDVLELGCKLETLKADLISANVYIGSEGIVEALKNGADIIITGRVADPALTVAPLMYEFGWELNTHANEIGQAILAGHLLECAGQVTGGFYADPGFKEVSNLEKLGFPLAEIQEDGNFVITKVLGSGGAVTTSTCKEQLLYEIHNPAAYFTPDAIADFSKVSFSQASCDVVLAKGAIAYQKPETLKVSIGYRDGFLGEGEISYGGMNALKRAKLAGDIVHKRLAIIGAKCEELRIDYIGYNALYQDKISKQLASATPAEVRLRVNARTRDLANATKIGNEVETLYTNGPAGGGGATKKASEIISICSIFVPRTIVKIDVKYLEV